MPGPARDTGVRPRFLKIIVGVIHGCIDRFQKQSSNCPCGKSPSLTDIGAAGQIYSNVKCTEL